MFFFLPPNWGRVAGRRESGLGGTVPLLILRVFVCSQPAPVLPLGGCMSMWVVAPRVSSVLYWALVLLEFIVCCTVVCCTVIVSVIVINTS